MEAQSGVTQRAWTGDRGPHRRRSVLRAPSTGDRQCRTCGAVQPSGGIRGRPGL